MLGPLAQDLRYAARRLVASPGFTVAAAATIALGVGIDTGLFSVLNGFALRELPVPAAGELVKLVACSEPETVTLGGEAPLEISGTFVSCNYFAVLRQPLARGSGFGRSSASPAMPKSRKSASSRRAWFTSRPLHAVGSAWSSS